MLGNKRQLRFAICITSKYKPYPTWLLVQAFLSQKEEEKKEDGGDDRCSNGLTFCDGICKHIHMCGKNYG